MAESPNHPHYDTPPSDDSSNRPRHGDKLHDVVPPQPHDEHDDDLEVDMPTRTGDMDQPGMDPERE